MSIGQIGAIGRLGLSQGKGVGALSLAFAPASDQPIITSGAGAPTFATHIAHAPKRIGDNTTNVDVNGDTKFRYPGVAAGAMVPATINSRVRCALMPGGSAQSRRWETQIEFVSSSKYIGLECVPFAAAPRLLVSVNGKWISASFTAPAVSGSLSNVTFEFQDNSERIVKLALDGGHQVVAIHTEAAHPPVKRAVAGKLLLCIGDSLTAGAGSPPSYASTFDTWAHGAASMLGFDHCCNASIGGTKWAAGGTGDVAISHFGGDRLQMALTVSPDAVVYCGSRNDGEADQAALDAIASAIDVALAATPVAKLFVMGLFIVRGKEPTIRAAAMAGGAVYVDVSDVQTAGDTGVDGVHPTYEGSVKQRNISAARLRAAGLRP